MYGQFIDSAAVRKAKLDEALEEYAKDKTCLWHDKKLVKYFNKLGTIGVNFALSIKRNGGNSGDFYHVHPIFTCLINNNPQTLASDSKDLITLSTTYNFKVFNNESNGFVMVHEDSIAPANHVSFGPFFKGDNKIVFYYKNKYDDPTVRDIRITAFELKIDEDEKIILQEYQSPMLKDVQIPKKESQQN